MLLHYYRYYWHWHEIYYKISQIQFNVPSVQTNDKTARHSNLLCQFVNSKGKKIWKLYKQRYVHSNCKRGASRISFRLLRTKNDKFKMITVARITIL